MENESHNRRNANEPYSIQLNNDDYGLTQEVINQNVDAKTRRRKDWPHVKLQFISLEKGILSLAIASAPDKEKLELTIKIEKDRLHVSCSCGQSSEKLCRHAYVALSHVSYSRIDSGFFKKYSPSGPVELALKHKKFFQHRLTGYHTDVNQQAALGVIYRFSDFNMKEGLTNALKLQGSPAPAVVVKEETALCYLLMHTSWRTLPFLIPAEAMLNRDGNAVKGFVKYIQNVDDPIVAGQCSIFQKSVSLMELVKLLPGTIKEAQKHNNAGLEAVFQLWKELLPLIKHQSFTFKSEHWLWRLLKGKPRKLDTHPVKFSDKVPVVQFELMDKGAYYRLQLTILINGATLIKYDPCRLFIFHRDQAYLLGSLRDAAIIEQWNELDGFLTIFKEHFDEFEEQILFKLSDAYFIKNYSENH